MKAPIIELLELGEPKSIIQRAGEPISELIDTGDLVKEMNEQLRLYFVVEHEVQLCRFCKVGDTNNDFGCTNPKCEMYPFQ